VPFCAKPPTQKSSPANKKQTARLTLGLMQISPAWKHSTSLRPPPSPRQQAKPANREQAHRRGFRNGCQRKPNSIRIRRGFIAKLADQILDAAQLRITQRRASSKIAEQQLEIVEVNGRVAVEIPLIPESGVAKSAQQNLKVVEVHRSVHVRVAIEIRLNDDLTGLQIAVLRSIASIGVRDAVPHIAAGKAADDLAVVDILLHRRLR